MENEEKKKELSSKDIEYIDKIIEKLLSVKGYVFIIIN